MKLKLAKIAGTKLLKEVKEVGTCIGNLSIDVRKQ